ncbi:unnamed protein product [Dibothriocephalus latus]|uniref:VWFA domain-containing protein n=1 Tax=Dibothriocephalus latus TaxID=60516 RepID=A0A3P7LFJ1_DIBLA|nr:unnamed protein product [Dibothriocephalus latus]
MPIDCKLPANLQIPGREYTVRLSANGTVVEHVFACGASCLRRVRTASLSGPRNCRCAVLWQESTQACCCRDVQTKSLAAVGSEAAADAFTQTWRDCSGSNAMLSDRLDGNGTDYRFAVVKYASNPSIAFNLDDYAVSPPMLHHVDNLHYEGRLSNLGRALDLTNREVLSKSRKDIVKMIYLISDGVNDISAAPDIAATLRASGVQINVLVFGSDKRGHIFLSKLASEPKQRHLVMIRATQQTKELSDWLVQTLCLRGCTQEPRLKTSCVSGRLINTKEVWRLRVNKFGIPACHQFKLEEDVTPILEKDCSRAATVVQGTCLPDGTRTDKIITKRLVDCQCKELVKTIPRRCFCPAKKTKTQCYSDKVQETSRILSKLVDGQCEETVEITRNTVVCSEPKVFATKCDSLTCQRRIVFVEERAHQCKCLRSLKATRETCCESSQKQVLF